MSNDNDIKAIIALEVDQQSVSASNQALAKIREGLAVHRSLEDFETWYLKAYNHFPNV